MARVCIRHPFILSENLCGRCGAEFCRECLVFPRGQKLPLCVTCAVIASGVRSKPNPALSKRAIRARAKARESELHVDDPAPLPEIANPVPAGWAFDEAEELPGARRDAERLPRATRRSAEQDGHAGAPNEMLTWLDSVYTIEE
jgi:hypothetical protein